MIEKNHESKICTPFIQASNPKTTLLRYVTKEPDTF